MSTDKYMTYDEYHAKCKAEWEAKHPGRDYDEYINSRVDEERGN